MTIAPATPDRIGPYTVVRPIARGGMAEVYEVKHPTSGEHLALKLLLQAGAALPRFNREYEAMIRLNHPAIVRVFHYGAFEGQPWLTMELLDGAVLQSRAKTLGAAGSKERTEEVLRVCWHVADALQYIHDRGLVHRDLKSANVIVLPDGRVKLFDFGTAKVRDPVEQITQVGEFVGTFAYASPEQVTSQPVDHRSDLYSFGVVIYRLLTGKPVFEAKEPHELARLHVKGTPRPMRELVPELPEELDELVGRMLAKSPSDRPQSAREVADAFERIVGRSLAALPGVGVAVQTERPVGREQEAHLTRAALRPDKPGSAAVVVGGDGTDPDRLVSAVAEAARVDGWRVFALSLRDGRTLRTLVDALRGLGRSGGARAASDRLRDLARDGALDLPHRRAELIELCVSCVGAVVSGGEGPALLVIPGLHRCGPVEHEVFASIRRRAEESGWAVSFLASADLGAHDTAGGLRRRWSGAEFIPLPPLSLPAVALAVGSLLHRRPPPAELARRIHAASGGQPRYVEEIVRELVVGGALSVDEGDGNRLRWVGAEPAALPLAPSAAEALEAALAVVPLAHRRALDVLAVAGEALDGAVIARTLGWPPSALRGVVDALEHAGWISVDDDTEALSLARALAGEVLRQRLSPARRRLLERALVEHGAELPGGARVRLLLAVGRVEEALGVGLDVAEELADVGQAARALDLLDPLSVAALGAPGLPPEELLRLHLLHTACMLLIRPTDLGTARALMRATELAKEPEQAARVDHVRSRLQWVIGHYPNHRKFLQRAWDTLPEGASSRLRAALAAELAQSYAWAGQGRARGEWVSTAQASARELRDVRDAAPVAVAEASEHFSQGRLRLAHAALDALIGALDGARPCASLWDALALQARVLRAEGRFTEALALVEPRLPEVRLHQAPTVYVQLLLSIASCEADLFRLGRAQEALDELDATLHRGEYLHLRVEADLVRGRMAMASGRLVEAERVLAEAARKAQQAQLVVLGERARAALGEALWVLGDTDAARDTLQAASLGLLGAGDLPALVDACVGRARAFGEEVAAQEIFRPVAEKIDSEAFVVARLERLLAEARHHRASGAGDSARLAFTKAAAALAHLGEGLDDTDRAALRVHPWSQIIRAGLR